MGLLEEGLGDFALVDTIVLEKYTGQTGDGEASFNPGVSIDCRVKGAHKLVRDESGQERMSTVQVLLEVTGITTNDRVTLPARFVPNQPAIIAVSRVTDDEGPSHERIMM